MLTRATAIEFSRVSSNGRTRPVMLVCEDTEEPEIELYAKLSARCDQGVLNLARETIAACLAADLGLPIPRPYLVEMPHAWISSLPDPSIRADIAASAAVAFGSRLVGQQFAAWHSGITLQAGMVQTALAIFVFDAIVQNDDRRDGNPNCLTLGGQLRIIDHELTFAHGLLVAWQPPWQLGSLERFAKPGAHIFREKLRRLAPDLAPVRAAWAGLPDSRVEAYAKAVPTEWADATTNVQKAIQLIKAARDNIDGCLSEIRRVLT